MATLDERNKRQIWRRKKSLRYQVQNGRITQAQADQILAVYTRKRQEIAQVRAGAIET